MTEEKRPKPTPEEVLRLRELEEHVKDGGWDDEYAELVDSRDWAPERIHKGNFMGLKTAFGEVILPPLYEDIKLLTHTLMEPGDRVVVKQGGKWGVAIADGKETWIWNPEFDDIGYPNVITFVKKGDKWGVFDLAEKKYLLPLEYDYIDDNDGFMFINGIGFFEKDALHGVMRENGSHTEAIFEDIDFEPDGPSKVKYEGKWGFINEEGSFTEKEDDASYVTYID
jgi:hypothetical protein